MSAILILALVAPCALLSPTAAGVLLLAILVREAEYLQAQAKRRG